MTSGGVVLVLTALLAFGSTVVRAEDHKSPSEHLPERFRTVPPGMEVVEARGKSIIVALPAPAAKLTEKEAALRACVPTLKDTAKQLGAKVQEIVAGKSYVVHVFTPGGEQVPRRLTLAPIYRGVLVITHLEKVQPQSFDLESISSCDVLGEKLTAYFLTIP